MKITNNVKLIFTASLLAFSVSTLAGMPAKPKKCPTAANISSTELTRDVVVQDQDGSWVVGVMSNAYGTKNNWTFVIGKIEADDEDDAFNKASASLSSLSLMRGPIAIQQISKWGCAYGNDENYPAVAVTPAFDGSLTSLSATARSLS